MRYESVDCIITGVSQKKPSGVAIQYGKQVVTYLQLEKRSNRIANFLYNRVKEVQETQKVIVFLHRSPQLIESILGILKCGFIFVPIDTNNTKSRMSQLLDETGAQWLITSKHYLNKVEEIIRQEKKDLQVLLVDDDIENRNRERNVFHIEDKPGNDTLDFERKPVKYCYIYFTSGSTGVPKGVLGRHRSLSHFLHWEINQFGVDENFKVSQLINPAFDPFLRDIFVPLAAGGTCCIPESSHIILDPTRLIRWIDENRINLVHLVPSLFKTLLLELEDSHCFENLKYILLAGELLRGKDIKKFCHIFPHIQLVNIYGPTETTLAKFFYRVKPGDASLPVIPVGKPIDGTMALILDEKMQKCRTGQIGEIYIRTPFISSGYFNDKELTKKRFIQNPFSHNPQDIIYKSGDLGKRLPDGNLILVGRLDHQVKIRGNRVEPGEIEKKLLDYPHITDAVVITRQDSPVNKNDAGDKYLCGYFVSNSQISISRLREYLSGELPVYMLPAYLIQVDKFPLTTNGKIDRNAFPRPRPEPALRHVSPRNRLEEKLAGLWSEVLEIEKEHIGIDTNFFKSGGHSIKAVVLIAKIHKVLAVKISLANLFKNPTIRKLADYLGKAVRDKFVSIEAAEKKHYYPLSSAQERLYFLQQLNLKNIGYNLTHTTTLHSEIKGENLERAFRELIERHESLRTSFFQLDGKPVQKIRQNVDLNIEYFAPPCLSGVRKIIDNFVRPFDLSRGPLMRTGLVKVGKNKNILIVDIHHIISDGVSRQILVKDFIALYSGKELTPFRLQYKDYVEWQNKQKGKEILKKQQEYWLKEFEGEIPQLDLVTDYPRSKNPSFAGSTIHFHLEREQTAGLKKIALDEDATMYLALLSIYNILLAKICNRDVILVGTPTAGRGHDDLKHIIGMFVNTLVLKNYPGGDQSFREFLAEVKTRTLKAFENQDYQFEDLVEKLAFPRQTNRNPIFDVAFGFQTIDMKQTHREIEEETYEYQRTTTRFDLGFYAIEVGEDLAFSIEYSTELFKEEKIRKLIQYFKEILDAVLENKEIRLKKIRISHHLKTASKEIPEMEFHL